MNTQRPSLVVRLAAVLWLALAALLPAGPSTLFLSEWYVPLELGTGNFALVNAADGQVRLGNVSAANAVSFSPGLRSYLSDLTGATSGFRAGAVEQLALFSATGNRVVFLPVNGDPPLQFYPQHPGPLAGGLVRTGVAAPDHVIFNSAFAAGGEYLELNRGPNVGGGTLITNLGPLQGFSGMQPLYQSAAGRRQTVCVWAIGTDHRFLTLFQNGGSMNGLSSDIIPADSRLASNAYGDDGRLMVVAYSVGSPTVRLITINTGVTPWAAVAGFPLDNAPFQIGSVAAVDIAGAPRGVLITSDDGKDAVHAEITALGTKLSVVQSFTPQLGSGITGLIPVPGRGILVLENDGSGASIYYRFLAWNGGNWEEEAADKLPELLPPATDFATIFWFDAEPLVNPSATLLDLESQPDWTNGTGALPSGLTQENFVNPTTGLANPVPSAASAPAGATWVIANQYSADVSVTALADNGALLHPSLQVTPPSGTYPQPVEVTATFDSSLYDVFFRNTDPPGNPWSAYTGPFTVGYTSGWQFYAQDKLTAVTGPVQQRSYTFALGDIDDYDSDGDSVPDFVEQQLGLNPNGGPDSDGDGRSDLEEILDGTDPADDTDFTPSALRNPPYNGEGFPLIAQATDSGAGVASAGERIDVHSMASALLASGSVQFLGSPPSLFGQLGAPLDIHTPISGREWAVLNSPLYFNLGALAPPPRDGREVYRLMQVPDIAPPVVAPVLTGTDLEADANAWIAAAQAAYATYYPVSTITEISPLDTALAVLGEAALYDALGALDASVQTALGVPASAELFTLFGERDGDNERTKLSPEMVSALLGDGLSFANLLTLLETEVASATDLQALVTALYAHHLAHSLSAPVTPPPPSYMPGLPMPLDVLRLVVRGGDLPYEVDSDPPGMPHWDYRPAAAQVLVDGAKAEIANILAQLPSAYRPTATWNVEVGPPTINGQPYGYTNTATLADVALLDEDGGPLNLDQGLGLAHGTQFSVLGYTDVTGPPGHDPIEVIALGMFSIPTPSDVDTNSNLLDDEWEKFFFGGLGIVGPHDPHPVTGFTYLQYMLSGADPRSDMPPDGVPLDLSPPVVTLLTLPNTNLGMQFSFPDLYFGSFDWAVQDAGIDLIFSDYPAASAPMQIGPNLYQIDLGPGAAGLGLHFFRVTMSLLE